MGKSMASGLPLAAVAGRPELMDALPRGGLGGTYSGNAVAYAAARVVMNVMSEDNLREWGERQEALIVGAHRRWQASGRFPMVGDMTGIGAMRGIIFEDTPRASGSEHLMTLLSAARDEGVLLMPSGRRRNVLRLLPSLTTEPDILEEGLNCIDRALETL